MKSKRLLVGFLGVLALVLTSAVISSQTGDENLYLSPMTIIYETDGPVVNSGSGPSQTIREVHRLEYRSETDWMDTVIESRRVDMVSGNFSWVYDTAGSYSRLGGRQLTEFDANPTIVIVSPAP